MTIERWWLLKPGVDDHKAIALLVAAPTPREGRAFAVGGQGSKRGLQLGCPSSCGGVLPHI